MTKYPGLAAVVLVCLILCSCNAAGFHPISSAESITADSSIPSPSPVVETPAPTPTPSPSPSPTPLPSPSPSPVPTPSPKPDPWAGKFSKSGAYLNVPDPVRGPWSYRDESLSVEIRLLRGGPMNHTYYMAEIYARGPLAFRGFAFQSDRGKTELPYKIARRYDAVIGITADYFNHRSNRKGVMMGSDVVYHDKNKNSTLAILPDGSLQAYEPGEVTAKQLKEMGVKDSFAFGPILVKDGKINKKSIEKHWLSSGALEYRATIGQIEKGHYIVIVTRGSFTMTQVAKLFTDKKCTMAYNMDGGHSACLIFMGEQLNQQYPGSKDGVRQRTLPDLLMIGVNPAVPDVKAKVFCNGVNVYYQNKPKPTNGPLN